MSMHKALHCHSAPAPRRPIVTAVAGQKLHKFAGSLWHWGCCCWGAGICMVSQTMMPYFLKPIVLPWQSEDKLHYQGRECKGLGPLHILYGIDY